MFRRGEKRMLVDSGLEALRIGLILMNRLS